MAKRKRLTPANPTFLDTPAPAPEAKSMFATPARAAPISDVARDASASAALSDMADTLAQARETGRMIVALPLDQIRLDYLIRDRVVVEEDAMQTLMASLRDRGQQTPIEVTALGPDSYGLISGWRRCKALARLAAEGADPAPTVLAVLRRPEEASDAYLAMVEENEIRVDLSYFERARIVAKAVDQGVFGSERTALQELFRAASRAKRSKIGSFLPVVRAIEDVLAFPDALSERLGLGLSQALGADPGFAARLRADLQASPATSPEAETERLSRALTTAKAALTQAKSGQDKSDLGKASGANASDAPPSDTSPKAETPPAFRDETVGAFTLREHGDGSFTVLGETMPERLKSDLRNLLKAVSLRTP